MRALTLTQPWATLVAIGVKNIETRSWSTSYRGPLAIHAAAGLRPVGGERGYLEQCRTPSFFTELIRHKPNRAGMFYDDDYFMGLPRGAIVAVCSLIACKPVPDSVLHGGWAIGPDEWLLTDQERAFGDYAPDCYAWLLADVRALPDPIPCRGAQRLWTVPADIAARLEMI